MALAVTQSRLYAGEGTGQFVSWRAGLLRLHERPDVVGHQLFRRVGFLHRGGRKRLYTRSVWCMDVVVCVRCKM